MKGRSVSADQKRYWDALARHVGCIACRLKGWPTPPVSIHHIDGRTKPGAHWLVLPLCASHHQDDGRPGFTAVHPWKARFEREFAKQTDLLEQCRELVQRAGFDGPVS